MIELEAEPKTVSEMSVCLNVDKSNASRTLATLLNQGVVESVPHPTDGRSMVFQLTSSGREKLAVLHSQLNGQVRAFIDLLEVDEQAALETSLTRYIRAMQTVPKQAGYTFRELTALDNASIAAVIRRVSAEYGLTGESGYGVTDPTLDCLSDVYAPENCAYWLIERDYRVLGGGGSPRLLVKTVWLNCRKCTFCRSCVVRGLQESWLLLLWHLPGGRVTAAATWKQQQT